MSLLKRPFILNCRENKLTTFQIDQLQKITKQIHQALGIDIIITDYCLDDRQKLKSGDITKYGWLATTVMGNEIYFQKYFNESSYYKLIYDQNEYGVKISHIKLERPNRPFEEKIIIDVECKDEQHLQHILKAVNL